MTIPIKGIRNSRPLHELKSKEDFKFDTWYWNPELIQTNSYGNQVCEAYMVQTVDHRKRFVEAYLKKYDETELMKLKETYYEPSEVPDNGWIPHFYSPSKTKIVSDKYWYEYIECYQKSQAKVRKQQRKVARRKKGSKRRQKAVKTLAKTHRKIVNTRRDFLHKVANEYIRLYRDIHIEALKICNLVKNKHLSKSISDAAWATFFEILLAKAEEAGRTVVKVKPHGTSQNCSGCGERVPKTLAVRIHHCTACGLVLDRDKNAALNILAG